MLTISHRGYSSEATENTLEAFDHADRLGADGIETDIRVTTDGRLVLFHDRRLVDGRAVCDLGYAELCKTVGFSVPTLEEALDRLQHTFWVLELKDPNATKKYICALTEFVSSRRLLVISFWHNVIAEVQRQLDVDCGVTVAHRPVDFRISSFTEGHTIVWRYEYTDKELIHESSANGHRNFVYNLQGIDEHRNCFELGVDGIITDKPLLAAACKKELPAENDSP